MSQQAAHRRHDISERIWNAIAKVLPGSKGKVGRRAFDNRLFINAVFWILRTGAPWRDLPPDYGDWKNTHRRFCRWRDRGIWESLMWQQFSGQSVKQLFVEYELFHILQVTNNR